MSSPDKNQQTILVVDDAPENIDVLSGILREKYKVKAATSGQKALAIAMSGSPPDLILLDIMMPEMNGYEVCQQLKAHMPTRRIPVIFCTAMGEVEDERKGFEVGCVDYITKPVSPPLVLARVKTQLDLYDQQRLLWRKVREQVKEINETRLSVIRCLGRAAEYKDDQTGNHVLRMASYSRLLGLAVCFSEADADMLFQAAPMHDVGKIGIPDHILLKPGKLTPDEWVIMQKHAEYGAEILGQHKSDLLRMAATIAHTHHERWDGAGYPQGLSGNDIPLVGRIVAIADVFDALSSIRPYKPAWSMQRVLEYFQEQRGKHFDPTLVDLMMPLIPQFEEIRDSFRDGIPANFSA